MTRTTIIRTVVIISNVVREEGCRIMLGRGRFVCTRTEQQIATSSHLLNPDHQTIIQVIINYLQSKAQNI